MAYKNLLSKWNLPLKPLNLAQLHERETFLCTHTDIIYFCTLHWFNRTFVNFCSASVQELLKHISVLSTYV